MTGRRVWWYFVAFFGFVAVVNAGMVTLAIRTHSGVVTEHPYEKGLTYNQVVEAEEKQESLGWKATIALHPSEENQNLAMLSFELRNRDGVLLEPDKAIASITRPMRQGMDFEVLLKGLETPVEFPANGLWEIRVDAVYEGVHFQRTQRIVVE